MKYLIALTFFCAFTLSAHAEVQCGASLNGTALQLEQNRAKPGVFFIREDDPNFDQVDIILDASRSGIVQATLTRFVSDADLPEVKALLEKMDAPTRDRLIGHFKPRVSTTRAGFDKDGEALFELSQWNFKLTGACRKK